MTALAQTPGAPPVAPEAIRVFKGTGGEAFAEQLIASGVKYVFGNSASEDAHFYEALVTRPQLQYILTPHEGPGAAMAAGYVKASGQPAIVMEAAVVGLTNALGQMFNAWKEQTPLVFYSYRSEDSLAAGRDGFEELPGQEQLTTPMTKLTWTAREAAQIPETVRRAFRVAWTPPYGPSYINWHGNYASEQISAEVIRHDQVDPRMRVRPNPVEVQRAAKLLVDARRPLLIVGDEIYKAKAFDKVVQLAELLALPVTQARSVHANFPQQHPLWVGGIPGGRVESLTYPTEMDVVINIGNKLQHNSTAPIVSRKTAFIDMRNDAASIGNVMTTAAPLVADVAYGTEDLLAAVNDLMTPALKARMAERAEETRAFSARARQLRGARVAQSVVGCESARGGPRHLRSGAVGRPRRDRGPRGRLGGDRAQLRVRSARRARALLLLRRASRIGYRDGGRRAARAAGQAGDLPRRRRLVPLRPHGALEHGAPAAARSPWSCTTTTPTAARITAPSRISEAPAGRSTRTSSCTTTWASPISIWRRSQKALAWTGSGRRRLPSSRPLSGARAGTRQKESRI